MKKTHYLTLLTIICMTLLSCSKEEKTPEIHITGVELSKTALSLKIGESETLSASVLPKNTTDSKNVDWDTSNQNIAIVDNGKVTALKVGETTITATAGGKTASCKVTVLPVNVSGIILNETDKEIQVDGTFTLTVTIEPDNATDKSVVWSTSDETIATVNDGVVTGISVGEVEITVSSGNVSAKCKVKVTPVPVIGISFIESAVSVVEGKTIQTNITISPENATNKNVKYRSLSEDVFTIDANGLISAVSPGTGKVYAITDDGALVASCDVTVLPFTEDLSIGMTISKYSNPGGYITFDGSVSLSNRSTKRILVDDFMILDSENVIIYGRDVSQYLNKDDKISMPVSFSNVYKAKAVFVVMDDGKEYIIEKNL